MTSKLIACALGATLAFTLGCGDPVIVSSESSAPAGTTKSPAPTPAPTSANKPTWIVYTYDG